MDAPTSSSPASVPFPPAWDVRVRRFRRALTVLCLLTAAVLLPLWVWPEALRSIEATEGASLTRRVGGFIAPFFGVAASLTLLHLLAVLAARALIGRRDQPRPRAVSTASTDVATAMGCLMAGGFLAGVILAVSGLIALVW